MSALAEVTVFQPRPMTWADIMRDRMARGLEGEPTCVTPLPAAKAKAPRKQRAAKSPDVAWGTANDPRLPSNVKPCTAPFQPAAKTAAQAAKSRRVAMTACLCRLCALALRPPLTFADQALYVGTVLTMEAEREIFGGLRTFTTHAASRESMQAAKEARELEARIESGAAKWLGTRWIVRGE